MKNKAARKILCLSVTAMLGLASPVGVMAAEQETAQEAGIGETGSENPENTEEAEERIPEDVTVTLLTGDVVIKNETERFFSGAEYKKAESKVVEGGEAAGQDSEQVAQTWDLVLTEEDGTVHTFQDVRADKWQEPVLTEQFEILYVAYLDEAQEKQEALEEKEEQTLDTPVPVYAVTDVNIREKPDTASQSLKVTKTGEEWSAIAALPGWVKVEKDGVTGYIHHKYVTEEKDSIEGLSPQEQSTPQQSPAQNTQNTAGNQNNYQEPSYTQPTQPQQPSVQEPSQPQQPSEPQEPSEPQQPTEPTEPTEPQQPEAPDTPGEVTELTREDMPNESGDGHGVIEITYSDGSVSYEEY